jgi:hypothetical protein
MTLTRSTFVALVTFVLLTLSSSATHAQAIAHLRTNCTGEPTPCFTTSGSLLNWIMATRKPNESSPLVVNVGPGTFSGAGTSGPNLVCSGTWDVSGAQIGFHGYTKFMGSGTQFAVQSDDDPSNDNHFSKFLSGAAGGTGFWIQGGYVAYGQTACENLEFYDMTFEGGLYGVVWYPSIPTANGQGYGGSSTWGRTEIKATFNTDRSEGWREESGVCGANPPISLGASPGRHVFYGSRVFAKNKKTIAAYSALCDETIFYGGEIIAEADAAASGATPTDLMAVKVSGDGSLETYGTTITADSAAGVNGAYDGEALRGVTAVAVGRDINPATGGGPRGAGKFEAYGGVIRASAATTTDEVAIAIEFDPALGSVAETTGSLLTVTPGPDFGEW